MTGNHRGRFLSGIILRVLLLGVITAPGLTPAHAAGPGPSLVSVSGRQLIVQKRNADGGLAPAAPYTIRGVVWSPASKNTSTSTTDPNNANKRRPELGIWAATDIPLMAEMNVNTVRLMIDPGFDATLGPTGLQILDALYARGIMVIMTVDDAINSTSRITSAVNFYKDHPAVLLWMLGNEWNINRYYGVATSVADAAQRTENAAALIKSLDSNHPVSTSYGDIDINGTDLRLEDTEHYVNDVATSVDVWGLNIYRGESFGTLFFQWASISTKPMFLSEFGTDAFFASCSRTNPPDGALDERTQGIWDLSLWNEVVENLSSNDPARVALGATVFEFNDEWWKVQPSGSQQQSGFLFVNGHPDDFANEEYFGIVDIDRQPRQIYHVLRRAFAAAAPDPSLSPPPRRVDFFSLPESVKTNIPAFPIAGRVQRNSRVFVNGTEITVDGGGSFVSRYPLSSAQNLAAGPNVIDLQVLLPDSSSTTTTKTIDYDSSFSTAETRLLYVDSVAASLPGTIVIDLDSGVPLGLLDQQHVVGIAPDGSAIYTQSRAVISTASHARLGAPADPLAFSTNIAGNSFLVGPLGNELYSVREILNRSNNSLLPSQLPASIVSGSSFGASVPGGPTITPDSQFIYCGTNKSSITKIDRTSLTSSAVPVPIERDFISDLTISPDGTLLGRVTFAGSTSFQVGFYDPVTLNRFNSVQVPGDFSGELVFSSQSECAIVGSSGNPAQRGGGITAIELPSYLQRSCTLIDLADNLTISSGNQVYVSSGTRSGVDVFDLQPCGKLQRSQTYYLGINQFISSIGTPKNDEIRRVVLRDLPALDVETAGPGGGTIESSPAGIACGSDCIEGYSGGTVVTLTATPETGSIFSGWTGSPDCADGVVTMNAARSCVAQFDRQVLTLTVSRSGNSSGTVTSTPAGISCGSDCSESYFYGTVVSLTATPDTGAVFAGWSGDPDCTDGAVTMQSARSCTATFNLQTFTLTVSRSGNGSGTVTSTPAGINCGNDCAEDYNYGTAVTLTPTPQTGSVFAGWSGDPDCTDGAVTMQAAKTCTATFNLQIFTLTVSRTGNGSGTVTSVPAGIDCGNDCAENYNYGTAVTLTPTPQTGSVFAGWSGDPDCTDGAVTMQAAKTCTATFNLQVFTLTVSRTGNGSGTVTSAPAGINCGNDCVENYNYGTAVTLTPTPQTGSVFAGWSGDPDCTDGAVTMQAAKTCTATFNLQVFTLTVSRSGNGSGTVTSAPAGINCGNDCAEDYNYGTAVTLTPTSETGSVFTGWSGDPDCADGAVTMQAAETCTATFNLQVFTLTVSRSGNGSGTVTSAPAGINCGSDCSENYNFGTAVTLTPTPQTSSVFAGWSGDPDCADGAVTMQAAKTCTATFNLQVFMLTVSRTGNGSGTVTSAPAGINCGSDCSENYNFGTAVTLTPTPQTDSVFAGWSGDPDCADGAVTMQAAKTCTATFNLQIFTLTVSLTGNGSGMVTSAPGGINCGNDCAEDYNYGTAVTLTPTPQTGSVFAGWSGDPDCADGAVTMQAAKTCTATFNLQTFTLTVSRSGNGSGTVTSAPAGINCGNDCAEDYNYGTAVTLTPTPQTGSVFAGWSGDPDCMDGAVTVQSAKTCTATFTLQIFTLTVSRSGNGSGTVTSAPAGIDCGSDCSEGYLYGTVVTLTPTPEAGSVFHGWTGHPDCVDGIIVLSSETVCDAEFRPNAMFEDGFESGNTDAWSAASPP